MRELERDRPDERARPRRGAGLPAIAIIGRGRVGGAIGRAAARAGLQVEPAGRSDAVAVAGRAEVALLCVPDEAIVEACEALAGAAPPVRFVGHVSGATPLDALDSARARGAATFSLHPLQTVPDARADLAGAPAAVAGSDETALELAERLADELGMRPFRVPEEHRTAYHAAAAIASNFLVALEESATGLLDAAGIEDARGLLTPLVLQTAANWAERGPKALTGPIARGDVATVEGHLAALGDLAPELLPLYTALAERARKLAATHAAGAPA